MEQVVANSQSSTTAANRAATPAKPPRIWPAVLMLLVFWAFYISIGFQDLAISGTFMRRAGAEALLLLVFPIWWLFARRIPLADRLAVFGAAVLGCTVAMFLSLKTLGVIGVLIFAVPWLFTCWTIGLIISRMFLPGALRAVLIVAVSLPWIAASLIRMDGLDGDLVAKIRWRWAGKPEDQFIAERAKATTDQPGLAEAKTSAKPLELRSGDWPLFRGPSRNSEVRNVKIETDWQKSPPTLVWRKRVGPGWSSVIIVDGKLFTQEQHDQAEAVICLDAETGKEIWSHEDKDARFWDSQSDAGPRATPAFDNGCIYAMGGTGIVNCLDAATGEKKWSRDVVKDTEAPLPMWGFSSSPLVVDGKVIVFAGGKDEQGLVAYDAKTGEPAWHANTGPISYSSAQLASFAGKPQILFLSDEGMISVEPDTGKACWKFDAPGHGMWRLAVQPTPVGEKGVLFGSEDLGLVSLDLAQDQQAWTATRHWTSNDMKPAYNDMVVLDGYIYGIDGAILSCIDAETGRRKWKGGRYGHGQLLLLPEQKLLLVATEKGEVALVSADPKQFKELAKFQAIDGKTWNHPIVAHGNLYVRNAEEMACYKLPASAAD